MSGLLTDDMMESRPGLSSDVFSTKCIISFLPQNERRIEGNMYQCINYVFAAY